MGGRLLIRTPKHSFGYGARQRNCAPERGGGGKPIIPSTSAFCGSTPPPGPPPQAGEGAHFRCRYCASTLPALPLQIFRGRKIARINRIGEKGLLAVSP